MIGTVAKDGRLCSQATQPARRLRVVKPIPGGFATKIVAGGERWRVGRRDYHSADGAHRHPNVGSATPPWSLRARFLLPEEVIEFGWCAQRLSAEDGYGAFEDCLGGARLVLEAVADGPGTSRQPDVMRFGFAPLCVGFAGVFDAAGHLVEVIQIGEWKATEFPIRSRIVRTGGIDVA